VTIFADNRALLDRFRRGDRDALAKVYYHYVDEVATLARRGFTIESSGHAVVRGVDADREREIVQETFAKAFAEKARLAYDGVQPYRPYLLRITKNLMIDRFRAERRDASEPEAECVVEPEDLHWKQLAAATAEHVATLDAESRRLIALRFEQELSQDDVAEAMGISRRRVRTLEDRVQHGLRKWLQSKGLLHD
jgi:RNA polymerase sigma-70 factor (ECF subfamily)